MKHLCASLVLLCSAYAVSAQPDCSQILNVGFSFGTQGNTVVLNNGTQTEFPNATTYKWDFGDGELSTDPNATHVYDLPGTYLVCLYGMVENCMDSVCQEVVITGGENPCDDLSADFTVTTQGVVVVFDASGPATGYHWVFGDGMQSFDSDPVHTYPEPGTYHACLVTWAWNPQTQDTCYAEHCEWVTIGDSSPCDDLVADFTVTTQGPVAAFNGYGGTAVGYLWYFGDNTQGDGSSPTHTYPGPGSYNACLLTWAWNSNTQDTCWAEYCEEITIDGVGPCDGLHA
ncbi:MAG TPA: PKD domain-containing protein, partial [Flavobacteriales bacterium]|nr:PKD domain-containing protein [Flavobacteriales bacterium]